MLNGPVVECLSKTGRICPVFEQSGFQMPFKKLDPFVRFTNGLVAILFLPFQNRTNWFGFPMAITKLDLLVQFSNDPKLDHFAIKIIL